jgi:hypothetical protein
MGAGFLASPARKGLIGGGKFKGGGGWVGFDGAYRSVYGETRLSLPITEYFGPSFCLSFDIFLRFRACALRVILVGRAGNLAKRGTLKFIKNVEGEQNPNHSLKFV